MNAVATDEKKPAGDAGALVADLELVCDASPFALFTEFLQGFLDRKQGSLNFIGDFPVEVVRVESNLSATDASKLLVKIYPSDAFLAYAGAIFANNFNPGIAE